MVLETMCGKLPADFDTGLPQLTGSSGVKWARRFLAENVIGAEETKREDRRHLTTVMAHEDRPKQRLKSAIGVRTSEVFKSQKKN